MPFSELSPFTSRHSQAWPPLLLRAVRESEDRGPRRRSRGPGFAASPIRIPSEIMWWIILVATICFANLSLIEPRMKMGAKTSRHTGIIQVQQTQLIIKDISLSAIIHVEPLKKHFVVISLLRSKDVCSMKVRTIGDEP